jgi:hypothetical protein
MAALPKPWRRNLGRIAYQPSLSNESAAGNSWLDDVEVSKSKPIQLARDIIEQLLGITVRHSVPGAAWSDTDCDPMYRPDRGYWPDQLSRDQRSEIFRCDDGRSQERATSAIVMKKSELENHLKES